MLNQLTNPRGAYTIEHLNDTERTFYPPVMQKALNISDTNIPLIKLDPSLSTSNVTLEGDNLNMQLVNGLKYKVQYTVKHSNYYSEIKTYYGTIKDSTIWIEDSEASIKIVLNSSTKATVYINRLLWYSLNIDKVYMYTVDNVTVTNTTRKLKSPIQPVDIHITEVSSTLSNSWSAYPVYNGRVFCVSFGTEGIYYSSDGKTWTLSNLTGTTLVIYKGGNVFLCGKSGTIYYSTDGKTWTASDSSTYTEASRYNSFKYFRELNIYVAGGGPYQFTYGGFAYSTDGKTWYDSNITSGHVGSNVYLKICNKQLYATTTVDNDSTKKYYTSNDGKTWTELSALPTKPSDYYDSYIHGVYFKTGYYSTNGDTWIANSNISGDIQYGNDLFVMSHPSKGIYYSSDGKTWTLSNLTGEGRYLYYNEGIWVVGLYNKGYYYSLDGKTWTAITSPYSSFAASNGVAYANGVYVFTDSSNGVTYAELPNVIHKIEGNMSGNSGEIYYGKNMWVMKGTSSGLYYSTDCINWTPSNITDITISSVTYHKGLWLAVRWNNGFYYSLDGKNWTECTYESTHTYQKIFTTPKLWFTEDYRATNQNSLHYSEDGIYWKTTNISKSCSVKSIIYNNSLYLAGLSSGIYYSTDGETWISSNIAESISNIVYHNNIYVAQGSSNIYYSSDGKTWTQCTLTSTYSLGKLSAANGLFHIIAGNNFLVSENGIDWQESYAYNAASNIIYNNGIWINYGTIMMYSHDGKTWLQGPHSNVTADICLCLPTISLITYKSNTPSGVHCSTNGIYWSPTNFNYGGTTRITKFVYSKGAVYMHAYDKKEIYYLKLYPIVGYEEVYQNANT